MPKVKIEFDRETCIGCGACVSVCPDNWSLAGHKAKPKKLALSEVGCNKEAENVCPVSCIKVIEK